MIRTLAVIIKYAIHNSIIYISYRVTGLYRLGKTCYLHSLQFAVQYSIIAQFPVQNDIISYYIPSVGITNITFLGLV